jgi:hypothetical protein
MAWACFQFLITPDYWTYLFIPKGFIAVIRSIEREPTDSLLSIVTVYHRFAFPISPTPTALDYIAEINEIDSLPDFVPSLQVRLRYRPSMHPAFCSSGRTNVIVRGFYIPDSDV